ncbi:MAG: GDSL-type esterase/lipase family protein [Thermoanaerobaculia bacterium]
MRRLLVWTLLVVSVALGATDAEAQFRYLCFGDSITLGNFDDDYDPDLGYPGRLAFASRLNCPAANCEVINKGKSGEKTPGGLTRIDNVLNNNPSHVLLLMEGTNDIFVEYDQDFPKWSFETMVFNLKEMARKAEVRGTDAVHASIIHFHPGGVFGNGKDGEVEDLRDEMASAASTNGRYFVDVWSVLCPTQNCFDNHYAPAPPDDRGHPDGSGYDIMADEFFNVITSVPVPGAPSTVSPKNTINTATPTFTWNRESPVRATWYRLQVDDSVGTVLDIWLKAADYCGGSSCSASSIVTLANGSHSWRVRGRNPKGTGSWSSSRSFTVSVSAAIFQDGFESGNTSAWSASLP